MKVYASIRFWLAVLLFTTLNNLTAQELPEQIKSLHFVEQHSFQSVAFASVAHVRTGFCYQSDHVGNLKLPLSVGDTLLFKCMGFHDTLMVVSSQQYHSDTLLFPVLSKTYNLDEVKVLAFYSYGAFRNRFANMPMIKDPKATIYFNLNNAIPQTYTNRNSAGTAGISMGLGFLYGKSTQQKYAQFKEGEKQKERLYELTSHENLKSFTGLEGPELDSFAIFLRTRYEFKSQMSDYDVMLAVQTAFENFLALKTTK